MKHGYLFSFFICLLLCTCGHSQSPTRILFIGNSFTYYNNMPQMVKGFADSAGLPVDIAMHAPPGVSVGDIAQGSQAHMNNPVLFNLIRSKKWDFVVIQDNQGRFVRDSAQFPASSLVVEGHIRLMDSVRTNNSCAKIILFGGWAFKNGSPPYGNTGIEMIRRILRNYVVLNDSMDEVISPIGEAWIKSVNYLPAVNLWDADDAHPSYAGSYLTASVIFSTIFNLPAKNLNYHGAIASATAATLRAFGDSAVFGAAFHAKYNLGGIKRIVPQEQSGHLSLPGTFASYTWYYDDIFISNTASLTPLADGNYWALVKESDGCRIKTCMYSYSATTVGISEKNEDAGIRVYPNPVSGELIIIRMERPGQVQKIELSGMSGIKEHVAFEHHAEEIRIPAGGLRPGCYILLLSLKDHVVRKLITVCE